MPKTLEGYLGLVAPVGFEFGIFKAPFVRKIIDAFEFGGLGNFNVRKHVLLL